LLLLGVITLSGFSTPWGLQEPLGLSYCVFQLPEWPLLLLRSLRNVYDHILPHTLVRLCQRFAWFKLCNWEVQRISSQRSCSLCTYYELESSPAWFQSL
jgi:hypothetical protein